MEFGGFPRKSLSGDIDFADLCDRVFHNTNISPKGWFWIPILQ